MAAILSRPRVNLISFNGECHPELNTYAININYRNIHLAGLNLIHIIAVMPREFYAISIDHQLNFMFNSLFWITCKKN